MARYVTLSECGSTGCVEFTALSGRNIRVALFSFIAAVWTLLDLIKNFID